MKDGAPDGDLEHVDSSEQVPPDKELNFPRIGRTHPVSLVLRSIWILGLT